MIGEAIAEILLYPIGRLFLFIRYRDKEKRRNVLKNEYDGHYSNVGRDAILSVFIIIVASMLIVLILIAIFSVFSPEGRAYFSNIK